MNRFPDCAKKDERKKQRVNRINAIKRMYHAKENRLFLYISQQANHRQENEK